MSADAKIWQEDNEHWHGICDARHGEVFKYSAYELSDLIGEIETMMERPSGMRWLLHVYPDGKAGLRGFTY